MDTIKKQKLLTTFDDLMGKRIFYRLMEISQSTKNIEHLYKYKTIKMSLWSICGRNNHNLDIVKNSFKSLREKSIVFEDDNSWESIRLIEKLKLKKQSTIVSFRINKLIWEMITEFSKDFKEFNSMVSLQSIYSMMMYELLHDKKTITIKIDELKEMFGCTYKYKLNSDFIKIIIERSKKEINEKMKIKFTYKLNKKSRTFHSITFKINDTNS